MPVPQYTELDAMPDSHRELARMMAAGTILPALLAEYTGMKQSTIINIQANPLFQEYVRGLRNAENARLMRTKEKLDELTDTAVDTIKEIIMGDNSANVRLKAAETVLDRSASGMFAKQTKATKFEQVSVVAGDDLLRLRQRGMSLGLHAPKAEVIDVVATDASPDQKKNQEEYDDDE